MQEIARHNIQGCTSYKKHDLAEMACQHVTLQRGDVLYMPKGIVHYATTRDNVTSTHLTVGLFRKGHTWRDIFSRQCRATNSDVVCQQLDRQLLAFSSTPAGLIWNDLAAPNSLEGSPLEIVCQQLNALVHGDHPAALSKLLIRSPAEVIAYEKSSRELLALLPDVTACHDLTLVDLLHHAETHQELSRARRGNSWTPPCRRSPTMCSASDCDCDSSKSNCNVATFQVGSDLICFCRLRRLRFSGVSFALYCNC